MAAGAEGLGASSVTFLGALVGSCTRNGREELGFKLPLIQEAGSADGA